jgi:electron transport complex protein RnfE
MIRRNPVFVMLLGLCPALAVTARVDNALGLGAAVLVVTAFSNVTISLLGKYVPENVRTPAYSVIIAAFVTVVDLLLRAYAPELSKNLGIFVPLTAVNCLILGRALSFARESSPGPSLLDAVKSGFAFLFALTLIALVREVLGSGTITLFPVGDFRGILVVPVLSESPIRIFGLAAGAFFVVGYLKALFDYAAARMSAGKEETES